MEASIYCTPSGRFWNSIDRNRSGKIYKRKDEETGREINLRLNDFKIDYYPDGKVEQFYSDLSVTEGDGGSDSRPEFTKLISVNNPLRFGSLTAYQTDWAVSGAKVIISAARRQAREARVAPLWVGRSHRTLRKKALQPGRQNSARL